MDSFFTIIIIIIIHSEIQFPNIGTSIPMWIDFGRLQSNCKPSFSVHGQSKLQICIVYGKGTMIMMYVVPT